MKVSQGIHYWLEYHKLHSKKSTLKTYKSVLPKVTAHFGVCSPFLAAEE